MAFDRRRVRSAGDMTVEISSSTRPGIGDSDCRERCGWWIFSGRVVMALAEGVGHGPDAAYAADAALACIGAGLDRPLDEVFAACHIRLRGTRGVALAIAVVDQESGRATLASVGNVRAVLLNVSPSFYSGAVGGIIGIGFDRLTPQTAILTPGSVIALSSDGLDEFLALGDVPRAEDFRIRDFAGDVLKRWTRSCDDVALLLYRHQGALFRQAVAAING